ncbi:hypothetical protein A0H81_09535 [Grifola frondosa]|uniref:Uncharacterized protein n=1 Tax=Grifola frondosa TaxID=5627 RepID=A0A1C7M2B4_GRIFR|nr:hypothetical protein A0H81_09535 [Grifola frondosa]
MEDCIHQGSITVCLGFLNVLQPHNTCWLTPAQRRLVQVRLAEDAGEAGEDSSTESAFTGLIMALKDPKVPIFAVMTCAQLLGLGFVNFFPTIAGTLSFSTTITLLLAAPPWIVTMFVCCLNVWHAGVIVSYIIGVITMSTGGRYVAMFLMASGYAASESSVASLCNAEAAAPGLDEGAYLGGV